MELKNFFAQSSSGNIVPNATVYVYASGTTNAVSVYDKNGAPKSNPFNTGTSGLIQFRAANGIYDVRVVTGEGSYTLETQVNDLNDAIADAAAEADRAEQARNAAMAAGDIYDDSAAGLAGTVDGEYFQVPGPDDNQFVTLYLNDAGTAVAIKTYPNDVALQVSNQQTTRLSRSLQRLGDEGQTLHADFAYNAYGIGSRMQGGINQALAGDDLLSISRASAKWVWQPIGPNGEFQLTEVPANMLSPAWNPIAGDPLGSSLEPAATNVILESNNFTAASWSRDDVTLVSGAIKSPDGDLNGCEVTVSAAPSGQVSLSSTRELPLSTRVTGSLYFKSGASSHVCLMIEGAFNDYAHGFFDLVNGVAGSVGGFGDTSNLNPVVSEMEPLPDGWFRCELSATTGTTGTGGYRVYFIPCNSEFSANPRNNSPDVAEGDSLFIYQAQGELGDKATSPISTGAAAATRAEDEVSRMLGDEHNPDGFSFYVEGDQASEAGALAYFSDGTFANSLRVGLPSSVTGVMALSGTNTGSASIPLSTFTSYVPGTPARIAVSVTSTTLTVALNGESHSVSISGVPAVDRVNIGSMGGSTNIIDGHVGNFRIYPYVMTEAKLVEITS